MYSVASSPPRTPTPRPSRRSLERNLTWARMRSPVISSAWARIRETEQKRTEANLFISYSVAVAVNLKYEWGLWTFDRLQRRWGRLDAREMDAVSDARRASDLPRTPYQRDPRDLGVHRRHRHRSCGWS